MERPAFLDHSPPPGYVAGIGRGASGFSTRGSNNKSSVKHNLKPNRFQSSETENRQNNNEDDKEAEKIFSSIDLKRHGRYKDNDDTGNVKLLSNSNQFTDLKRSLDKVSENEWINFPEATDMTKRNKRNRLQEQMNRKTYAAPDSLVSETVNLTSLTQEREKVLQRQLDTKFSSLPDHIKDNSITESEKYLKALDYPNLNNLSASASQSENIKKMRVILQSYRNSNSKEPQGWIASARLEERANKFKTAKKIILEGCQICPKSEDIWLETVRLHESDLHQCKIYIANGIRLIPNSTKLWLKAVELENETFNKQRVVRKALQEIPTNEELWKFSVKYETDSLEKAKILTKAVELVPRSIDLWMSLIKLQDYKSSKKSLNMMRKILPDNFQVWILASQLEEKQGNCTIDRLRSLLTKGINEMKKSGHDLMYFKYLEKSIEIERNKEYLLTTRALINVLINSIASNKKIPDDLLKFIEQLDNCLTKVLCYRELLIINPIRYKLWKSLREACLQTKLINELYNVYQIVLFDNINNDIIKEVPSLVLLYAKDVWKHSCDPDRAIKILNTAIDIKPMSVDIWFAKIKILAQNKKYDDAEAVFNQMFTKFEGHSTVGDIERLYYKYISFLRFKSKSGNAISLLKNICIVKFPKCFKFHLQLGQIYEDSGKYEEGRACYFEGTKLFPTQPLFWIYLSKIDETIFNKTSKARSELEIGIVKNPNDSEMLYEALIELEIRNNNSEQAKLLVAQALKSLPTSPIIWVENIKLSSGHKATQKKVIFQDALRKTSNHHTVLLEISKSFFRDTQYSTALKWAERAIRAQPDYGDSWVWLARTYQKLERDLQPCLERVELQEPTHGPEWTAITKNPRTQYYDSQEVLLSLVQ